MQHFADMFGTYFACMRFTIIQSQNVNVEVIQRRDENV